MIWIVDLPKSENIFEEALEAYRSYGESRQGGKALSPISEASLSVVDEVETFTFTDSETDDEQPPKQVSQVFGKRGTQFGTNPKGIFRKLHTYASKAYFSVQL